LHSTSDAEKRTGVPDIPGHGGSATGAGGSIQTGEFYSL
jgi:hypothetical protein